MSKRLHHFSDTFLSKPHLEVNVHATYLADFPLALSPRYTRSHTLQHAANSPQWREDEGFPLLLFPPLHHHYPTTYQSLVYKYFRPVAAERAKLAVG
jgi:hypothetical protein